MKKKGAFSKKVIGLPTRGLFSSKKTKMLLCHLLLVASVTTGNAQTTDTAKLNRLFDRLAEKNQAMGSLSIVRDGSVVYTRNIGYGRISGSEKKPLNTASRFRIGSITKMFTAVMILQLAEEGKLKLSDRLDKFLPQIPNAGKITLAHILAHRSGIHDAVVDKNLRPSPKTEPITQEQLLSLIAKGNPDFEPDTKYAYSNSGYILLGLLLQKLTGKPYAEALTERIPSRIGLRDTYVATGNIDVSRNEALTYRNIGGEWKQESETHPSNLFSAGAIVSTPSDLSGFIRALFDLKLLSKESLATMKTMKDGEGMAMDTFTFAGKTFYGHTGGADNYGAWLAYLPEEKLAVAYTTNAKVYPVGKIMDGILAIYYNRPFEIPSFETVEVSPEVLDKYTGVYSSPSLPVKFTIGRNGAKLYVQPNGQAATPMEATAQNKFTITAGVTLEFDAEKRQMTLSRAGRETVFTKEN